MAEMSHIYVKNLVLVARDDNFLERNYCNDLNDLHLEVFS